MKGQTHTLLLDRNGARTISVAAPLDITKKEIKRIKGWLQVTLLIEPASGPNETDKPAQVKGQET